MWTKAVDIGIKLPIAPWGEGAGKRGRAAPAVVRMGKHSSVDRDGAWISAACVAHFPFAAGVSEMNLKRAEKSLPPWP